MKQRLFALLMAFVLIATSGPAVPVTAYGDQDEFSDYTMVGDNIAAISDEVQVLPETGEVEGLEAKSEAEEEVVEEDVPAVQSEEEAAEESEDPNAGIDLQANEPNSYANGVVDGEVIKNLSYSDDKTHTLTVNGTLKGTIHVTKGTLNIEGNGIINGNGAATVIHVEGGNAVLNVNKNGGCVTITGGNGGTKLNDSDEFPNYYSGGGILVQRKSGKGATLNLYNGKITGNYAGSGAGIHIDRDCAFYLVRTITAPR